MAENGISIINSHIKNNSFSNIYLLGGAEKYLVKQFREKLVAALCPEADSMNHMVFKTDNINSGSIVSFAQELPFFAERRVLEIIDSDYFKKGNEDIEALLSELPETTVIIFDETNIDKRSRLYKLIAKIGTVALFDTPDEKILFSWINGLFSDDGIQTDARAIMRLVESVGTDMNTLNMEVEKLKSYALETGVITAEDVEQLCVNQIEGKIFEMMDALSKRDSRTTMRLYSDLVSLREPAMRILYLITRQFIILTKTKFALEKNHSSSELAAFLKVPPFTVKKYIEQSKGYTYEQLLSRTNMCQEADSAIKSGRLRDSVAVELLVVELLRP